MMLEKWNLARLMEEGMVNTMVLVLWRYLKIFAMQDAFYFRMFHLAVHR